MSGQDPADPGVYRVRKWGDPILVQDANLTTENWPDNQLTSNFQAVSLWNDASKLFGAVDQYLRIPHADVMRLRDKQTYPDGYTADQKMNWLAGDYRGRIYMHEQEENWDDAEYIRWGTIALGGNLVEIDRVEEMTVHLPAQPAGEKTTLKMGRLLCFTPSDWHHTHSTAPQLIHRCFCAYNNDEFGDSPKGIVWSPLWSPKHWTYIGPAKPQPTAFWIPMRWLEAA